MRVCASGTPPGTDPCPEDAGPWEYYDGSWAMGDIAVACATPLAPPAPPLAPPPLAPGCACDALVVSLGGAALSAQWETAGPYDRVDTAHEGRPVYRLAGEVERYIYYSFAFNEGAGWFVGESYALSNLMALSTDPCPEEAGSWKYWATQQYEVGDIAVRCISPPSPPVPPTPPFSCACDAVRTSGA